MTERVIFISYFYTTSFFYVLQARDWYIFNNLLYLATRSPLAGAPNLTKSAPTATARSAIKSSFVSPERWEMMTVNAEFLAILTTSRVSLRVPIWLTFTRMLLQAFKSIAFFNRFGLVTRRSSPTILVESPISAVRFFQSSQASS